MWVCGNSKCEGAEGGAGGNRLQGSAGHNLGNSPLADDFLFSINSYGAI